MPGDDEYFQEYHSHIYGPIGIFLMDIRGNRITGDGVQHSENPMVSDDQWDSLGRVWLHVNLTSQTFTSSFTENFFNTEGLQVIILANEIPFVGDDPDSI